MKNLTFILPSVVVAFFSCKKDYSCVCFNPGGVFKTEKIHDTKKNAEKQCSKISEPYNYPFSESGCSLK